MSHRSRHTARVERAGRVGGAGAATAGILLAYHLALGGFGSTSALVVAFAVPALAVAGALTGAAAYLVVAIALETVRE